MDWKYLKTAASVNRLKKAEVWNQWALKDLRDAYTWIRKMLVTSKLCLLNAEVGAEYALPDEMVEEVAKYVYPIKRMRGEVKWMFRIEDAGGAIFGD